MHRQNTAALPEHDGGDEAENGNGADGGAAEIDEHLLPGLGLLPAPLAPHEVLVPPLGRLLLLLRPSLPGPRHGRREQPQGAFAADRRAIGVLDGKADLPDVGGLLGAGDGGLKLAAAEHDRVAHQRVARVPVPVHGDGAAAGHVHRAPAGGVDRDPAELQLRRGHGGGGAADDGHGGAALALHGVDAERRGEEPRGRRGGLHDAGEQRLPAVVDVHGGDELAGDGDGDGVGELLSRGGIAREREGVGEEALRRDGGGGGEEEVWARGQRRPAREAERAPRLRIRGERSEARGGAAGGGQGRPVEAAQRAGQHVGGKVLHGGGAPRHALNGPGAALRFNGASSTGRVTPSHKSRSATLQGCSSSRLSDNDKRERRAAGWRYGSAARCSSFNRAGDDGAWRAVCLWKYGYDTVRQRRAVPLLSDEWPRLREGDDVTALTGRVRPASVRRTGA